MGNYFSKQSVPQAQTAAIWSMVIQFSNAELLIILYYLLTWVE